MLSEITALHMSAGTMHGHDWVVFWAIIGLPLAALARTAVRVQRDARDPGASWPPDRPHVEPPQDDHT